MPRSHNMSVRACLAQPKHNFESIALLVSVHSVKLFIYNK